MRRTLSWLLATLLVFSAASALAAKKAPAAKAPRPAAAMAATGTATLIAKAASAPLRTFFLMFPFGDRDRNSVVSGEILMAIN